MQNQEAANSIMEPAPAFTAISKLWAAFADLKAVPPDELALLSMHDDKGRSFAVERFLDNLRAETVWLKQHVHAERMKILRGQK